MNASGNSKVIVICGYPKSGNTWLTRLVAELVECPVEGFFGSDQPEIAIEGKDRISEYVCYKSHHEYEFFDSSNEVYKLLYIVRDPRDIAVSGASYFRNTWAIENKRYKQKLFGRLLNRLHWETYAKGKMISEMVRAVEDGNPRVNKWCSISWKSHVLSFHRKREQCIIVRYEDLLAKPVDVCKEVMLGLEISASDEHIKNSIQKQSFEAVKQKFSNKNEKSKYGFLRKGGTGDWKSQLSKSQIDRIETSASDLMKELGYLS